MRVSLTESGLELRTKLDGTFGRHLEALEGSIDRDELVAANASLRKLERFWLQQLGFGPRIANDPLFSTAA